MINSRFARQKIRTSTSATVPLHLHRMASTEIDSFTIIPQMRLVPQVALSTLISIVLAWAWNMISEAVFAVG